MNILAIDTSNELLGIAVQKEGRPVIEFSSNVKKDHSSRLMPAIVDTMKKAELEPEALNKIVVAQGPGSYTGVRIGITTAKTMAWALDIPIYPVSSLQALAYNGALFDGYIWPFFDARRKAIFTGLYKFGEDKLETVIEEQHIPMENYLQQLSQLEGKIVCLSPHIDIFRVVMEEKLGDQIIFPTNEAIHLTRPFNYIQLSDEVESVHAHLVKPNYLRMTEAEAKLLKIKKGESR